MKLYLLIKKMIFDEDNVEHQIINGVWDEKFPGYDVEVELNDNDKFIEDTLRIVYKQDYLGNDTEEIESKAFITKEQETWNGFPLYELKDREIVPFDYTKYDYFANTNRRNVLASKINDLYNPSSEAKILRKAIKFILDELRLDYPDFLLYNEKVEEIIKKNPKEKK